MYPPSAVVLFALGCSAFAALPSFSATIVTQDPALAEMVPKRPYEGVGIWRIGAFYVATGHSIEVDTLGQAKGQRTERTIAEEDCKHRILKEVAKKTIADFDSESFDLVADMSGFRVAATYTLGKPSGLFLVGVVEAEKVKVQTVFNPKRSRAIAFDYFYAGRFKDAAARFAVLTQRGIQDAETVAYARVASWHVNIEAGIRGQSRREAMEGLGRFYYDQEEYESSVKYYYELYRDTDLPSRELLTMLAKLCEDTHRDNSADAFRREMNRRYPKEK